MSIFVLRCLSSQGHRQDRSARPFLPSLLLSSPSSSSVFLPTLAGSRLFRFTPPKGIPCGWLTENTSYRAAQTGLRASSSDTHTHTHTYSSKHTIPHTVGGQSLHQLSCGWWSGAEGKEVTFFLNVEVSFLTALYGLTERQLPWVHVLCIWEGGRKMFKTTTTNAGLALNNFSSKLKVTEKCS